MIKEKEELIVDIIKDCYSYSDVCKKLNICITNGNYITIKNIINKYQIDITHFKRIGNTSNNGLKISLDSILTENSNYGSNKLKKRLFKENLKECKCENCHNDIWMGVQMPLELHHVNGNSRDNRFENLTILCPNCHSLTNTYAGKNIRTFNKNKKYCFVCGDEINNGNKKYCSKICYNKNKNKSIFIKKDDIIKCSMVSKTLSEMSDFFKIKRTTMYFWCKNLNCSDEVKNNLKNNRNKNKTEDNRTKINDLLERFRELKSFVKVGKYYNVSDNAVRKWCKNFNLPIKTKSMKEYVHTYYGI